MKLLLLPGLLCDGAVWTGVRARLAQDDATACIDCEVPPIADAASLDAMAASVLASAPPRFALAGHSMGARVALEVVAQAPHRVERVALLDTGCRARPVGAAGEDERVRRLALLALARQRGMRAMGEAWLAPMVHRSRLADAALIEAILAMIERQTPERFERQIEALLARPDRTALLPKLPRPVLFACGREDAWSPLSAHEEMAALTAGSRLFVFEGCGHMAPMERPKEVADALAAWCRAPVETGPRVPAETGQRAHAERELRTGAGTGARAAAGTECSRR